MRRRALFIAPSDARYVYAMRADCLNIASAHGYKYAPLITFDRKTARLTGAELLT